MLRIVYCAAPLILQTDEPLNETHTKTNKTGDNEQKQEGLSGNSPDKRVDPADSGSHQRSDRGNNLRHENTPLQTSEPLDQTNAETDKADNDKHENQRIIGDGADKGANPGDRSGDKRTNVVNDSGERTNSRSRRR